MSEVAYVLIDAKTAKAAAIAAAFTDEEDGRTTIHSFVHLAGIAMGAACDLDTVIEKIDNAVEIAWVHHPVKHDLAVVDQDGRCHYFDVRGDWA